MMHFFISLFALIISTNVIGCFVSASPSAETKPTTYIVTAPASANPSDTTQFSIRPKTSSSSPPIDPSKEKLWCTATYNQDGNNTGWNYISLTTDPTQYSSSALTSHAACGFAEGYLTLEITSYSIMSLWSKDTDPKKDILGRYIMDQIAFVRGVAKNGHKSASASFTRKLGHLLALCDGLVLGLNARSKLNDVPFNYRPNADWSIFHVFLMNMKEEEGDILWALHARGLYPGDDDVSQQNLLRPQDSPLNWHCSSAVTLSEDKKFLSFAHATWTMFTETVTKISRYNFGGTTVSFSGWPLLIHSCQDFHVTSNGLYQMETTNTQNNLTLKKLYVVNETVPEFLRMMIANFEATEPDDWADLYLTLNSGTYSNQQINFWSKYASRDAKTGEIILHNGALQILEQLPESYPGEYSRYGDQTEILRSTNRWSSYNIPFYEEVYNMSGYPELLREQGNFWSYTKCNRAMIFKRDQVKTVKDVNSTARLIRYNQYRTDPLSRIVGKFGEDFCEGCNPNFNPCDAISCRSDLQSPTATWGDLPKAAQGNYHLLGAGGTDAKFVTFDQMEDDKNINNNLKQKLSFYAQNGPTTQGGLPPFTWSKSQPPVQAQRVIGLPDEYNFPWVLVDQSSEDRSHFIENMVYPQINTYPMPNNGQHETSYWSVYMTVGFVLGALVFAGVIFSHFTSGRTRKEKKDGENNDETKLIS